MIDQSLHRNTRPLEAGLTIEAVAIYPDEFAQYSLLFVSHHSRVG